MVMVDLSEHFSSRAKVRILELLCRHPSPLPLRQIADLCSLPVFSVQRALADLKRKRIVRREKRERSTLYTLEPTHPYTPFLLSLFRWIEEETLKARAKSYSESAQSALAFASEAHEIYVAVRKRNRDA